MNYHTTVRGLTLIEVVMYIALYSMIVGGIIQILWIMNDMQSGTTTESLLDEEEIFVVSRIEYTAREAHTIDIGDQCTSVTFTTIDDRYTTFSFTENGISVDDGSGELPMLNDRVSVVRVSCGVRLIQTSDRAISMFDERIDMSATTSQGFVRTRTFYLHAPIEN